MKLSRTRRALAGALALSLLAPTSAATWSIVAVDTATGEVVVAGATCLAGFDLLAGLPVVRVGVGGAAAQSLIDQLGGNRKKIWDGFVAGDSPQEILDLLKATDGKSGQRQYGIVDMLHAPVKFTGKQVEQAKKALVGQVGTIRYAMQGNVLTGTQVIVDAEAKFLAKPGDLGERVLAAMLAARNLGGDPADPGFNPAYDPAPGDLKEVAQEKADKRDIYNCEHLSVALMESDIACQNATEALEDLLGVIAEIDSGELEGEELEEKKEEKEEKELLIAASCFKAAEIQDEWNNGDGQGTALHCACGGTSWPGPAAACMMSSGPSGKSYDSTETPRHSVSIAKLRGGRNGRRTPPASPVR